MAKSSVISPSYFAIEFSTHPIGNGVNTKKTNGAFRDIWSRGVLRIGSRSRVPGTFLSVFTWFTVFPQMCERAIAKVPNERINAVLLRHKRSRRLTSAMKGGRRRRWRCWCKTHRTITMTSHVSCESHVKIAFIKLSLIMVLHVVGNSLFCKVTPLQLMKYKSC